MNKEMEMPPFVVIIFALNMIANTLMVRAIYPTMRRKSFGRRTRLATFGLFALALEGSVTLLSVIHFGENDDSLIFGYNIKDLLIIGYAAANCLVFIWVYLFHRSAR